MFIAMTADRRLHQLHSHAEATLWQAVAFYCPACRQPVRIKNGAVLPAHFAHIGAACDASSEAESGDHLAGKQWLAALGKKLGYAVTLERYYPAIKQRADVVWQREETTIVIEFQCSPLSSQRLQARQAGYHSLGVTCIWVLGPEYQHGRPGARQLKFLQSQQFGDYHLWFGDGQRKLERWQWQPGGYHITRYFVGGRQERQLSTRHSRYQNARRVINQLRYRDRQVLALQAEAYQKHRHLAGLPWAVHDQLSGLPGLPAPEWQLRTRWLLRFEDAAISRSEEQAFWQAQAKPALTPLVNAEDLLQLVARFWRKQLVAAGYLTATASGWRWKRQMVWYPDDQQKLAAIDRE